MIMLDTNYLIAAEQPGSEVDRRLRQWLANGETFAVSTIVWTEYLCGPLAADKVAAVEFLVRRKESFLAADAPLTARLFNAAGRRRGTLTDCMIAAVAVNNCAAEGVTPCLVKRLLARLRAHGRRAKPKLAPFCSRPSRRKVRLPRVPASLPRELRSLF